MGVFMLTTYRDGSILVHMTTANTRLWKVMQTWQEPGPRGGRGKPLAQDYLTIADSRDGAIKKVQDQAGTRTGLQIGLQDEKWYAWEVEDDWEFHGGVRVRR
jgi:hypothetical protein